MAGILRSAKTAVSADYIAGDVPVASLQCRSTLTDLLAVVPPKPCVSTVQTGLCLVPLIQLVQKRHVISSVLVLLH